ncbi:MAG: FAD-dependent oxidoreductase, partial [Ktedonobacterales bacterium]
DGGVFVQLPPWYVDQRVTLAQGITVTALDTAAKTATLSDGNTVSYGKTLYATGGRPRTLDITGMNLPSVFVLRTLDDATAIRQALEAITAAGATPNVVVVGSGFIGLEGAANALFKGAQVTLVDPVARAWVGMVPPGVSSYIQTQFSRRGATLYYDHAVSGFIAGPDGKLSATRIANIQDTNAQPIEIACDLAIVGVGIQLNSELADAAGLATDPRHGVVVDDHLRASAADVYAAGDVAAYPDPVAGRMHFEHWDNAIASAQTAAANLTGGDEIYRHVPYFFSDQFDLAINMLGYPSAMATLVVRGDVTKDAFTTLFAEGGILRAAMMVNDDAQMDLLRELIAANTRLPADLAPLGDPTFDLATLKQADAPANAPAGE